ncbi:putative amidase [Cyphellophora attinorum]|uniref:Putative amidase n=1 Tax=Cyphellophora attinorum TaxID=1664694 RepID=A0A0N1HI71_9EURO|nr:putative amidase [Phialophora attinorum]KPI45946.1 putative amidase [Phialophora attinorum]
MSLCKGQILEEASIDDMQTWMSSGIMTAVDLLSCYIDRYNQVDWYTNSVLQLNPDAMAIAKVTDDERAAGRVRGPLHGIPFLVKDNYATKDKMETTAGFWGLVGNIVPRDAHVVKGLRNAGGVLFGHATLTEWAGMRSNNYSEGYSPRGDQTRSPYNLTVNPGGSSSGPAVAVAGNQIPIAIGTETDGSIINPAERNAVVGIKPTVGLTSRAGVIPGSHSQDSTGPFGKTVRDAVYALDAMYGPDPNDNYTLAQIGKTPEGGYAQFLADKSALKGAVFGIPWLSLWNVNKAPGQNEALLELIVLIESAGATIINGTELPSWETTIPQDGWNWDYGTTRGYPNESEFTVVKTDFYNDIRAYLSELNNTDLKSLEDIINYILDNFGSEGGLPGIHPAYGSGQDNFLVYNETQGIYNETYWQAKEFIRRTSQEEGIDGALAAISPNHPSGKTKLDALLAPPDAGQSYSVAAQAGYPLITLPAGVGGALSSSMPYGLMLMGSAWSEATLIKYASAIEDLQLSQPEGYPYRRTKLRGRIGGAEVFP